MGGSSPSATPIQLSPGAPPKPPPGYGPVRSAFEQVFPHLFNMPLPSFQGQVDPGLSPTMANLIRGAQTYSQSPFPRSLEQASGTLGAFQNFDKLPGADFQYQMDPSHESMYAFQKPSLERPQDPFGAPPDYGFNVQPQTQMAEGGGGGYGSEKIVKMQEGGGGGLGSFGTPVSPGWDPNNFQTHQGGQGYWWAPGGGQLDFNPNPADGRLGDSKWGRFWNWLQGQTGFTPGSQHGPNAEFWDAIHPQGFDFGRSGPINPTDTMDPHQTGYGWWSADPNAAGMDMPPWLKGLNDEQMKFVFDLVGNIPPGMRQPLDTMGQHLVGEQLTDPGGFSLPPGGGGGGRGGGGGGGGGVPINFQGIPGYQPMEVNPSFVGWDPGNPTPSLVAGNEIMPPEPPPFHAPPPLPPAPAPAPPGFPGGGGGGGGDGQRPRPQIPARSQGPPPMAGGPESLQALFDLIFGGGGPLGGMGMGLSGSGGGTPGAGPTTETQPIRTNEGYEFPAFAEGNVVDHPQLAMIGEAGPEVVLPLTRPAKDEGIRKMQEILGLPVTGMQYGGGGGFGPRPQNPRTPTPPFPGFGGGTPPAGGGTPPSSQGGAGGVVYPNTPSGVPRWDGPLPGQNPPPMGASPPQAPTPFTPPGLKPPPAFGGGRSPAPGGRGGPQLGRNVPPQVPGGPRSTTGPGGRKPPAGGRGGPILNPKPTTAPGGPEVTTLPFPTDPRLQDPRAAYDAWQQATGRQDLGFQDWMKPSQANWFKDAWQNRQGSGGDPVLGTKPAPAPFDPGGRQPPGVRDDGKPVLSPKPEVTTLPFPATPPGQEGVGLFPGNPQVLGPPGQAPTQPPWQPQQNGLPQSPFGPTSAMDVFRSAVPVMNDVMQQQIQGALAQAGMTGNRFGTSTERNVADIGRMAGNQLTNQMGQLLYGQTQADLDRALEATGMGLQDARFRNQLGFQGQQNALDRAMQAAGMGGQFGQIQDQMMQDRLRLPFQIGAWEQGRQDQFARMPYDDFMQSRLGFLPQLFQLMASQGGAGGMSPQFGVHQTGGSPGALDYISALAPIFMGMLAEGGAAGKDATKYVGGY